MRVMFFSGSIGNVHEAEKLASSLFGCTQRHLEAVTVNATGHLAPSRLCLVLPMSGCGTGRFIEFDDPLPLKWRSSSLRAREILHRHQVNHMEITVPADFIVSLIYVNQGGKELYRLQIYISKTILVVNDVQPAHWYIDCNKAPTITPPVIKKKSNA